MSSHRLFTAFGHPDMDLGWAGDLHALKEYIAYYYHERLHQSIYVTQQFQASKEI